VGDEVDRIFDEMVGDEWDIVDEWDDADSIPEGTWKQKDRTLIKISDMTDSHLDNSIKLCQRTGRESIILRLLAERDRRSERLWNEKIRAERIKNKIGPSTRTIQYADYILNHYSKKSLADKTVLAKDLERHGFVP